MPAERAAAVVLKRVADGDGDNQQQRRFPAERPARGREQPERQSDVDRRECRDRRRLQGAATRRSLSPRPRARALRVRASHPRAPRRRAYPECATATQTSATAMPPAGRDTCAPARAAMSAYSRNASSATSTAMPSRKIGCRNHSAAITATSRIAPLMTLTITWLLAGPTPRAVPRGLRPLGVLAAMSCLVLRCATSVRALAWA